MPLRMITCYIQMLPVIKAEESLHHYQAAVCANGPKNKRQERQMKRQVKEWQKTMNRYSGRAARPKPKLSFEEMKAILAGMGIKVKIKE